MKRCPITYEECGTEQYSLKGLHLLSRQLNDSFYFPYSTEEQLQLAAKLATKMSIAGVQPKISVRLNVKEARFSITERGGTYIIKPQHPYFPEVPENEDLTMKLAAMYGINTPVHGMIYGSNGQLSYFIKRFDRHGAHKKWGVEDFAQLSSATRKTKYESSMEKVGQIIEEYCTFPMVEKLKLFKLTVFCFVIGNDDMHLKNFSLIHYPDKVELSPAYDLLNTQIILKSDEEMALPLRGKKRKLRREHFVDYFGHERLGLRIELLEETLEELARVVSSWKALIQKSFLSLQKQEAYLAVLEKNLRCLEVW